MRLNRLNVITAAAGVALFLPLSACLQATVAKEAALSNCKAATGYWCDHERGWHFYEEPELGAPAPPKAEPGATNPEAPKAANKAPELQEFEQLKKRVEELRNIAYINPTEANVRRYMDLEAKVVRQASYFADVAQRVAWATPSLDMTLEGRPVNSRALEVFNQQELASRVRSVASINKDHAIFFFFRSDCPYCHAFAPTLATFQAKYGIQVVPVSVDGAGLPDFPSYRVDNGISKTLDVAQVPAVFLAQPFTGKIVPLGFGVLSEGQLLERVAAATAPDAEKMLPGISKKLTLQ